MANLSKNKATVIVLILVVVLIAGIKFVMDSSRPELMGGISARAKGNPDATLKITEFIDFECPACAKGSIFLSKYIEQYPDRIYLKIKYFPIGVHHKNAYRSAHYAECAARQEKFWPFHDLLVEYQYQWRGLLNADPVFEKFAKESGLEMKELNVCLQDESVRKVIDNNKEQGNSLGIRSTPTYIINGKVIVGTHSLVEELKAAFGTEN